MKAALYVLLVLGGVMLGFECAKSPPPVAPFVKPSYACFVQDVEPELERSCTFANCHGKVTRAMHLYSMAGERGPSVDPADYQLSDAEHRANYSRVIVYASATSSELPDLLRKPLQLEAGGAGHGGVDRFGHNVYGSKTDEGWLKLSNWVNGIGCDAGDTGTGGGGGGGGDMGGGAATGGSGPGGGSGTGGGNVGPQCLPRQGDWDSIAQFVNPTNCSDSSCHTPENVATRDAGCFLPTSCESVRQGGCEPPLAVVPCNPLQSKFWRYSGPFPFKNHNDRFPAGADILIGEWIDAGASCDGGPFP